MLTVFLIIELIGLIGIARAAAAVHTYCLNHPWLKHTSQAGAWTFALGYAAAVLLVFYFAHMASTSIALLIAGSAIGSVAAVPLILMTAVVVGHMIWGFCFVIPYLARLFAAFSPSSK